jgi:murein DD-endopeptidase MepM/ murein hydrolase activator NlpD
VALVKRLKVASTIAVVASVLFAVPAAAAAPDSGLGWRESLESLGPPAGDGVAQPASPVPGSYAWPVVGPVIRGYQPPSNPYSSGHRGIDIAVPFGTAIQAPNDGVVSFAGWVGGALYLSIDHPDGVRTTYSWLSAVSVHKGQSVRRGDVIALTGHGHPEIPTPHLHFGARVGANYIDPMFLLDGADVADLIRLAPLDGPVR